MLLDPKVYVCSRTGADKVGYFAKAGDRVHEFLSDDSEYDIYINGHTVKVERDYVLQDGDMVNAIHRPAGVETYIAVALIVAIITIATLPKPEKPNTQGTKSTSPNNQVSGQTNIARTGEGIPDIKGIIRAFPDLIQSSWYSFEENRRRVRERFCVGTSSISISQVMDNETLFSDIGGSDFSVIEREVQTGDSYPVHASSLDGSRLLAENQRVLQIHYIYLARDGGNNYVMLAIHPTQDIQALLDLDNEADFSLSNTSSSEMNKTFIINKSVPITTSNEITSEDDGFATGDVTAYRIPVTVQTNFPAYSATRYNSPDNNFFQNGAENVNVGASPVIKGTVRVGEETDGFTNWTKMGRSGNTAFDWWLNLDFQGGLIKDNGDTESVSIQIQARDSVTQASASMTASIDGSVVSVGSDISFPVSGRTRGRLGRSVEVLQTQPNQGNRVEVRIRRADPIDITNATSDVNIETMYSLIPYNVGQLGSGLTLIDVDARSDLTNSAQSSRKINMMAARKQFRAADIFGSWDFYYGDVHNWFSDAILSDFIELFGQAKAEKILDFDSLYTAMDAVPSELKEFNYSYDDADISLGQRIATAANAARVGAYRDGQVWRFYREESKPVTFHFDRRNIAGNAESQMSFRFQKPNDHDSVSLSYIDPIDNKERHIERRINGTNDGFEAGLGVRPLEIDLAGCRNTAQATNRAELEVRRLVYQRRTVSERVLDDGLLVDIGDRVRWACIYDGDIVDGEVLEVSGSQVRISEKLRVTGTLFGHITDINGDVHGPYSVSAGSNGDFWIDGFDTSKAFVANNMPTQLGSRVIIGTTENLDYYDFTVTSKTPNPDGTVQIEMIEYNELMFSED